MHRFLFHAALALGVSGSTLAAMPTVEAHLVKDLNTQPDSSGAAAPPATFRTIGDAVYFAAMTPQTGAELYRTDGTPGGLAFVADIVPGAASSNPTALGFAGPHLIVETYVPGRPVQLWSVTGGAACRSRRPRPCLICPERSMRSAAPAAG